MQPAIDSKPEDLLSLFQPRFRRIELVPHRFGGSIHNAEHICYLWPKHVGAQKPIHPTLYRGDRDNGKFALFDLREAKVGFDFRFDPTDPLPLGEQLDAAAGRAIMEGPLKGIEFYIDPSPDEQIQKMMGFVLSNSQGVIPGLKIPQELRASCWQFFFPESPERDAIECALQIQERKSKVKKIDEATSEKSQLTTQIDQLGHQLQEKITAAAA